MSMIKTLTCSILKIMAFFLTLSAITALANGQSITGNWYGSLDIQGTQLDLVFHIEQSDSGYSATFDSPDQGAGDIPFTSATFDAPNLKLQAGNIGVVYEGKVDNNSITGTWKQGGRSFKLNMSRNKLEKNKPKRPQEPEKPYPYHEEEVAFKNKGDSLTLAGTLTLPAKNGTFPAIILISGSGPQNRNEESYGHKPFLVLADHLTRKGIAVLRYDDRGTAESTGNHSTATSADFAADLESAIKYLKTRSEVDSQHIGLIGHSEGASIASVVASRNRDVAFIVMLAGIGITGKELNIYQASALSFYNEIPDKEAYEEYVRRTVDIASADKKIAAVKNELTEYYHNSEVLEELLAANPKLLSGMDKNTFIENLVQFRTNPWIRNVYSYDPAEFLRKITVPVLSLHGSNDIQVPAKMNQEPIRKALEQSGNEDFTVKELPGLNHMFQESKTGSMSEYSKIEQTFSPLALGEITRWINSHTN